MPIPPQAAILSELLRERESPQELLPKWTADSTGPAGDRTATHDPQGQPLMPEGTLLIERPGRLVRTGDVAEFVFVPSAAEPQTLRLEILPTELLELMERLAASGESEFVVTAEVTRYHGQNRIFLRKVLRHVSHGNVAP